MKYKFYFIRISLFIIFINNFDLLAQELRNSNLKWQKIPNTKKLERKRKYNLEKIYRRRS